MKLWHVASLALLTSCVTTTKPQKSLPVYSAPTAVPTRFANVMPALLSSPPVRRYPLNTNPIGLRTNVIPILWHTNQLIGKTQFDVQESHDLKTWATIQTNIQGEPWVTNTVNTTYWRIVAR